MVSGTKGNTDADSVGHEKPPAGDCRIGSPSPPKSPDLSPAAPVQAPPGVDPEPTGPLVDLSRRLALRPAELAASLGVSVRGLRSIAHELPRVRRGSVVLYPVRAVSAWLDKEAKADGDQVRGVVREVLAKLESGK